MPEPIRAEQIIGNFTHVEPWREVGTADNPSFENFWANLDANRPARFYKDPFGTVHLDGIVSTGTVGTTIFTLPVGYRPDHVGGNAHFPVTSNSAFGQVIINIDGSVTSSVGAAAWTSLAGITFRAV